MAAGLLACGLALSGCATPGALHVYSVPAPNAETIGDFGPDRAADTPSYVEPHERITGFAYDPFTDHLFLRLAPGNRLRVVDRPARKIKREFTPAEVPTIGGGDLAVKPRTGHLFLLHPTAPQVIELTRLAKWVRTFALDSLVRVPAGIAYDARDDRLLILESEPRQVSLFDLDGKRVGTITLQSEARGPLAFDSETRELYASLPASRQIGVFDEAGTLKRTLPIAAEYFDVGPRSFLRVF